jgi:hypothetical protein
VIDLSTLARVRFRRSTRVHAVTTTETSRRTHCGEFVHLNEYSRAGRLLDEPLPPETPVTCPACLKAAP